MDADKKTAYDVLMGRVKVLREWAADSNGAAQKYDQMAKADRERAQRQLDEAQALLNACAALMGLGD